MLPIEIQVRPLSVDNSQRITLPTLPASVIVPLFAPEQTVSFAGKVVPPTVTGSTVIVTIPEVSAGHTPLCTITWYWVVCVRLVNDSVVVVFAIGLQVRPPSVENSQRVIDPVCPDKVTDPLLVPLHTEIGVAVVPPTDVGLTVMVVIEEYVAVQPLLCTSARYRVVVVRLV